MSVAEMKALAASSDCEQAHMNLPSVVGENISASSRKNLVALLRQLRAGLSVAAHYWRGHCASTSADCGNHGTGNKSTCDTACRRARNGLLSVSAASNCNRQRYHGDYSHCAWASNLDEASSGHVSGSCLRAANRLLRGHAARQYERQGYNRDKCQPLHRHFPRRVR
jgi:hypothetical protein